MLASDTQWDGFVIDISETGAQLELFDTQSIPDEFLLIVAGGAKRLCQMVWRSKDRVGVTFVRHQERLAPSTAMSALRRKHTTTAE